MRFTFLGSPTAWLFGAVFALVSADSMPAQAHTDFIRRTSLDAMVHWETPIVRMQVDPALERQFGPGIRQALTEAARAWDLGGNVPSVELVHEVTDADRKRAFEENTNWVGFADRWTFGDKLAVTVSTFDAESGALVSAQVWINPDRKFELAPEKLATSGDDAYDLQAVLTHEVGHVLGLGEADDVPEATMFPTFHRGEMRQRTLSETDEAAIDELYTATASSASSSKCSSAAPGLGGTSNWPLFVVAAACLLPRRRARLFQ